jgi:hypothetical protein
MKIGIMTFWRATDNYGAMLQCYALQRFLRNAGHEAFVIRYAFGDHEIKARGSLFIKLLNPHAIVTYIIRQYMKSRRIDRKFFAFRDSHIILSEKIYFTLDELRKNPPDADVYICGSDQIWNFPDNFMHRTNSIQAFFLNFGPKGIRRIAYAPSFCHKKYTKKFVNYIKPLLANFDFVSVREPSGVTICNDAGYKNARCMLDPCFLLSQSDYLKLIDVKKEVDVPEKYIFLYILRNKTTIPIKEIKAFAEQHNLKIKYVTNHNKKLFRNGQLIIPSIEEWIYLIKNAECVITNSFHGTVFSLIFEKKFITLPLMGIKHYVDMNERVEHILNLFNQMMRFKNSDVAQILTIDKPKIDESIIQENKSWLLELLRDM